jgi:hypothetical protein
MDGEVDSKALMRMNAILLSDLNQLLNRIGDYGQVKQMLKAWRRIVLGILTAAVGTLVPYILTFLRLLGIIP